MEPQEILSKSYTDSISSLVNNYLDEERNLSRRNSCTNQSIVSSLSNRYNSMSSPMPINAATNVRSMNQLSDTPGALPSHSFPNRRNSLGESSFFSLSSVDEYEDEEITPLPKLQLFVISIMLFSEPLTSTILLPFIYFMLKDFHLSNDEKEIGSYAGWITSIFFVAQFCTAILWGRISDRFGRRPVLLTGLIGNSISSCLFGLSKNLWWAISARALCGIVNGNAGVARSMVSEITDNTNKAKAFSIFGFCWGVGMICGPALGGYLSKPAENFPYLFGDVQFLIKYPYFLPCFVSAIGSFIGFIVGYFYLKESNPAVIEKSRRDEEERTHLLGNGKHFAPANESYIKTSMPKSGSINKITMTSVSIIIAYSLFSFHAMVFDEVLPLYFTAPTYAGGLGITSTEFAKMLSVLGVIQLFFQFVVYPRATRLWNTLQLIRVSFLVFIPLYFIFPELTPLRIWLEANVIDETTKYWVFRGGYFALLFVRFLCNCISFTSLGIMISTSALPEVLGTVNGICQSCLSLVRALAPTIGGTLWSYSLKDERIYPFDFHLVYYMIGIMTFIGFIQSYGVPVNVALGGKK